MTQSQADLVQAMRAHLTAREEAKEEPEGSAELLESLRGLLERLSREKVSFTKSLQDSVAGLSKQDGYEQYRDVFEGFALRTGKALG